MKNKSIYIRLILTHLLIFMLPMLINIVSLIQISNSTRENILNGVKTSLSHAQNTLDNNFAEIDAIVNNLSSNSVIRHIAVNMDEEDKNIEISKLLQARDLMKAMRLQSFAGEYYLYFNNNGLAVTPDKIFLDQSSVQLFFRYDGMSLTEWNDVVSGQYFSHFFAEADVALQNGVSERMLLYAQSLVTYAGTKGTFIFPIQRSEIVQLLEDDYTANGGWAYMLDKNGMVLLTLSGADEVPPALPDNIWTGKAETGEFRQNGRTLDFICSHSEQTGLTLVEVIPRDLLSVHVNEALRRNLLLTSVIVILGIASIGFVSWRRGRKIDSILQILFQESQKPVSGEEIDYISDSLKTLISSNRILAENIKNQEPITRSLLVERLLKDGSIGIEKSLEDNGIDLKRKDVLLLVYRIGEIAGGDLELTADETTVYKQLLLERIHEIFPASLYDCDTEIDAGAILIVAPEIVQEDRAAFCSQLEEVCSMLWERFGVGLKIVVSDICRETTQLSAAYNKSMETLTFSGDSNQDRFILFNGEEASEYYYFPISLEERIVNTVKIGSTERLKETIREIYQVNLMERNLSAPMLHFLINDLQCAVFKALHSIDPRIQLEESDVLHQLELLNHEKDILLRFKCLQQIFTQICEQVQAETYESNDSQKKTIEQYLQKNYGNRELSLRKIADDFGYASTYFSKLFKELFQENFAVRLEKIRIEQVCVLLLQGMTLERIAEQTGYNSVNVMRAAFKRLKGVSPMEYRKLHENQSNEKQ